MRKIGISKLVPPYAGSGNEKYLYLNSLHHTTSHQNKKQHYEKVNMSSVTNKSAQTLKALLQRPGHPLLLTNV